LHCAAALLFYGTSAALGTRKFWPIAMTTSAAPLLRWQSLELQTTSDTNVWQFRNPFHSSAHADRRGRNGTGKSQPVRAILRFLRA